MRPAPAGPWSRRPSSPPSRLWGSGWTGESWTRSSSGTPVPAGAGRWRTSAPCSGGRPWNTSWPWSWASRSTPFRSGPSAAPRPFLWAPLFHVTAGNVDGLPAFSAVEGLLTGNINLVKLPSGDQGLSLAVFQLLTEQEPRLAPFLYAFQIPSRDTAAPATAGRSGRRGGGVGRRRAVTALRQLAPPGCKLMEWGPPPQLCLSVPVGGRGGRSLRSGGAPHPDRGTALLLLPGHLSGHGRPRGRGRPSAGAFSPCWSGQRTASVLPLGRRGGEPVRLGDPAGARRRPAARTLFPGRGCSLTLREDRELELSPLHGNVLVKCLPQKALLPVLRRQKGRLQTAGLLCPAQDRPALTQLLARAGVTRIAPPGSMSRTLSGEGHDGEFPLRRYVRTVDIQEPSPDRPI